MQETLTFSDLGLSANALQAVARKGFEAPSPIQVQVIPILLAGRTDLIGQAQTGTGKTAAFGLPILEKIDPRAESTQALILTPTRELCIQVAEELISLCIDRRIQILPVYGGQSMELQLRRLKKGVQIIVGTPGRVLDHLRRRSLDLSRLSICVLDEADEMLNMGFLEDVGSILEHTPDEKQTLLFSATLPPEILKISRKYMRDAQVIRIQDKQMTVLKTDQIYFQVSENDKFEALCRIIDMEEDFYGLVFCRTKVDADRIANHLLDRGYDADVLHGDLSQSQRETVMGRFKKKHIRILVATDVAARGIDVGNLTHVINFALPQDPEGYVHRIGRTGRAGKSGTAITFITPSEERKLLFIERKTRSVIRRGALPRVKDVIRAKKSRIENDLQTILDQETFGNYVDMARSLLREKESEPVLAALLKYAFEDRLDPHNYNEIRDVEPKIPGQTRLFIARGKKDGMTPRKLEHLIGQYARLQADAVQDVFIQEEFSFVTLPYKEAAILLKQFRNPRGGKRPLVTRARPSEETGEKKRRLFKPSAKKSGGLKHKPRKSTPGRP
ncbi:DEAD/DEAH box helicase [candidate division KSB1 bacterium]|nr:DEAD/DEAH box helicase [candidate division KSB1 bacterium]